ncbi:TauD/TfdA family dioxygenase [Streptosporangium subroseum]|uniref:TauD/TfdA family dioxygenase n=1 Tax=Streptosporangium subroseum TaxID=106412 RepID=UPI00308BE891|nr:clavaminate synthase family protein [Streptosporangium subroseum]
MSVAIDTTSAGSGSVSLSADDVRQTERVAASVAAASPGLVDDPAWIGAARRGWDELPASLRHALRGFRRDSGPTGTLLLRGLPVRDPALPPTPVVNGSVQREATVPAALLMSIACGLGDPTSFASEKSGALVQDVVPVPGREDFQGNAGSVLLSFHNENAFHPHRPDFVLLICLRADHDGLAGLRTACVRTVLPLLSSGAREVLGSPQFVTAPPPSFGAGAGDATTPHPVLSGAPDDPDLRVDLAATEPLGPRAADALSELAELFDRTAQTFRLLPQDLVIVDNRVTVHGRTAFQPRYDGRDRWLQRTFVCADLRRSRAWRPGDGHVLTG